MTRLHLAQFPSAWTPTPNCLASSSLRAWLPLSGCRTWYLAGLETLSTAGNVGYSYFVLGRLLSDQRSVRVAFAECSDTYSTLLLCVLLSLSLHPSPPSPLLSFLSLTCSLTSTPPTLVICRQPHFGSCSEDRSHPRSLFQVAVRSFNHNLHSKSLYQDHRICCFTIEEIYSTLNFSSLAQLCNTYCVDLLSAILHTSLIVRTVWHMFPG